MNKDHEKKARFIPCGDSLEKMNEISDEDLEDVSGGAKIQLMVYCPEEILPRENGDS